MRYVRLYTKKLGNVLMLQKPINRLWNTYEHLKFTYYCRKHLRSNSSCADIDPTRIIWVSPSNIYHLSGSSFDSFTDTARLVDGAWDQNPRPLTTEPAYNLFRARFCDGREWQETEWYTEHATAIQEGSHSRYVSLEELHDKLERYEKLYEQFSNGQYRTQADLVAEGVITLPGDGGRALFPSRTDKSLLRHEIAINIGRDGTLFRNDGRHRLALALLTNLEEIPVRIVVRHTEWQSLRDTVAQTIDDALDRGVDPKNVRHDVNESLTGELEAIQFGLNHPDLEPLFERRLPDT